LSALQFGASSFETLASQAPQDEVSEPHGEERGTRVSNHEAEDSAISFVMAGLVPAIHVFLGSAAKTWMPGTSPGMTG
jgi:hypothetical protein